MSNYINLSDFKKLKRIGNGKFANVYLVENNETQEQYAAKVSTRQCDNYQDQKVFMNEIQIFLGSYYPSIIEFKGFSLCNLKGEAIYPTILMKYMENGNLEDALKKERLNKPLNGWSTTKKYIIIIGIALGVQFLHKKNIIHRDLKPANILLDENCYPKISDFGVSKIFNQNSNSYTETYAGTPLYMAPEIGESDNYSFPADVYSFAIVLYEIFTGVDLLQWADKQTKKKGKPFRTKILEGLRPDIDNIKSMSQKELLINCWNPNPDSRFTFHEIVNYLLKNHNSLFEELDENEINMYLSRFGILNFEVKPKSTSKFVDKYINDLSIYKKVSPISSYGSYAYFSIIENPKTNEKYTSMDFNPEIWQVISTSDFDYDFRKCLLDIINEFCEINHPNIPTIRFYSFAHSLVNPKATNVPSFLFDYYRNLTLNDVLSSLSKLDNTSKQIIICGIANGMKYFHSRNIYQCVLTPSCIFLDDQFNPQIVFHFSKILNDLYRESRKQRQKHNDLILDEIITYSLRCFDRFENDSSSREDNIFSFGLILYEIVTGKSPYEDCPANKIFTKFRLLDPELPKFPDGTNQYLEQLILRCWSKEQSKIPSFNEIYDLLSSNKNYYLPDVNETKYSEYVQSLNESDSKINGRTYEWFCSLMDHTEGRNIFYEL